VTPARPPAALLRRLAATVYEDLLLAGLLTVLAFMLLPFVSPASQSAAALAESATHYIMSPTARAFSGGVSFVACGAYCIVLWSGGRRTLAMKTWGLALRADDGAAVAPQQAALRYLACWIGPLLAIGAYLALRPTGHQRWAVVLLAVNYVWALADPERLWLQDRLARTRLVAGPAWTGAPSSRLQARGWAPL
jgi:uncharacterized RDD family membrane protein YckC